MTSAVPPDVRNGSAFPSFALLFRGCAAIFAIVAEIGGAAAESGDEIYGKAEPFRTSAGKARRRFLRYLF